MERNVSSFNICLSKSIEMFFLEVELVEQTHLEGVLLLVEDAARRFHQRKLVLFGFRRNWVVLRIFNPFYHCFIGSASKRRSAFWVGYFRPSSCFITPVRSQVLVGLLCERAGSIPSMQKTRRQCIDCSS